MIYVAYLLVFIVSLAGVMELTSPPYGPKDIILSTVCFTISYFIFYAIQQGAY